jgi:hypothetical protein
MTVERGETPELEAITGPSASPSADPDPRTKQELKRASKDAKKPQPAERLEIHLRAQITETCQERDRLRSDYAQLQKQLGEALPEIKRMKEASLHVSIANVLATIFIAVGGILVSAASNHPRHTTELL